MPKNLGRYDSDLSVPRKKDIDDLANVVDSKYSASNPPPYPVISVNTKTGAVVLDASDVGALPDTTVIPAVNNATLDVQRNGISVGTFTANASANKTINITVPTKASDVGAINRTGDSVQGTFEFGDKYGGVTVITDSTSSGVHMYELVPDKFVSVIIPSDDSENEVGFFGGSQISNGMMAVGSELVRLVNIGQPIQNTDAANKAYVDDAVAGKADASTLTTHINNKSNPHGVTAAQAGAVPVARTINGKELTSNITLTGDDIPMGAGDSTSVNTALQYRCNPNLLDNWYFGNPVNQRGQTQYSGMGYTIDRWMIDVQSINVVDNGITLNNALDMFQRCERITMNQLLGKTVTLSLLTADNRLFYGTMTLPSVRKSGGEFVTAYTDAHGALQCYIDGTDNSNIDQIFRIYTNTTITILAAKLELGSTQTLARKEGNKWMLNEIPDYGEQLRKCQRYFRRFTTTDGNDASIAIGYAFDESSVLFVLELGTVMRASPSINFDGRLVARFGSSQEVDAVDALNTGFCGDKVNVHLNFDGSPYFRAQTACDVYLPSGSYLDISADLQ